MKKGEKHGTTATPRRAGNGTFSRKNRESRKIAFARGKGQEKKKAEYIGGNLTGKVSHPVKSSFRERISPKFLNRFTNQYRGCQPSGKCHTSAPKGS